MDWQDLLKKLGLNPTQLQWRWMNLQRSVSNANASAARRREQAAYQHKVCRGCGNILDHNDKFCPRCTMPAPTWHAEVARKAEPTVAGPNVTVLLLGAIILNFVIGLLGFGWDNLMHPTGLLAQGAMSRVAVEHGQWWRVISTGYLHIGIVHLLFNGTALYQSGMLLEPELGSAAFFSAYTLSMLGGSVADLYFGPGVSAGASGAIAGLIGLGLSYCHFRGMLAGRKFFWQWVVYAIVFTIAVEGLSHVGIDNYAHGGGFAAGLVMGWVLSHNWAARKSWWNIVSGLCLVVTLVAMGFMGRNMLSGLLVHQGEAHLQQGDVAGAEQVLSQAVQRNPQDGEAWFDLGNAHLDGKDFTAAIDDYTHAIDLLSAPEAYFNRGLCYLETNQPNLARLDFEVAAKNIPEAQQQLDQLKGEKP